jgi:hypothetical protein
MKLIRLQDPSIAKITEIPDIETLQALLAEEGQYGNSEAEYSLKSPAGWIKTKLFWMHNSVEVKILKKPWLISNELIWDELEKRL